MVNLRAIGEVLMLVYNDYYRLDSFWLPETSVGDGYPDLEQRVKKLELKVNILDA